MTVSRVAVLAVPPGLASKTAVQSVVQEQKGHVVQLHEQAYLVSPALSAERLSCKACLKEESGPYEILVALQERFLKENAATPNARIPLPCWRYPFSVELHLYGAPRRQGVRSAFFCSGTEVC